MRPEIYLQLDADIYESWRCRVSGWGFYNLAYNIHDNRDYTHEFLEAYEDELEFRETYIEGTLLPSLDLKIGRQIVVWGNTENFRVTDVLNPLDNRTPGLVDIEDLRWPVCMAKMDYYWGNCSLTAIAIPELFFGESPVYGSDFFPYTGEMQPASQEMPPAAGASAPFNYSLPEENKPAQNLENTELALAFQGIFSGWDFSLYAAHYYNDMVHPEQVDQIQAVNPNTGEPVNIPVYELEHAELNMFGAELNVISGNYMFKAEAAYKDGYEFANVDDEKSRLDTLVGVEYSGFSDIMLFFEVVYSCFFDFDEEADAATTVAEENEYGDFGSQARQAAGYVEEDWFEVALRYTQNFMRERLELTCLTMWHDVDGRDAMVERLSLAYDVTDTVTATVGGIFYQGGDQPGLGWIHKNNRLYLNLKYSF